MNAERNVIRRQIYSNLGNSTAEYPLQKALIDLDAYRDAGTFHGAIKSLSQDESSMERVNTQIMVGALGGGNTDDARITALNARIDALDNSTAIDIIKHLPPISQEANATLVSVYKDKLPPTNGNDAKEMIKFLVTYEHSQNANTLSVWEALIRSR